MRIIHLIDYFQPLLGYQETFLAREHAEAGHDVFVVTSDRYHPFLYKDEKKPMNEERIRAAGFSIEAGVQVWRLETGFELPNLLWLKGLEKKIREMMPDLVIVHGITSITALRVAMLKNSGRKFSLIFDDHATSDNATGWMKVLYAPFRWLVTSRIMKSADALVAILPATKEFMMSRYGIPESRITVIPMGADLNLFHYDEEHRRELRDRFRFKDTDVVFIYAGKIIPFRQVSVLIDAFSRLADEYASVKLLFVGDADPDYLSQLKFQIEEKGLESRVSWQESVPNDLLYRYYSAADVSVWPFAASIGMREAMACSLPIIIGENSMVTELVEGHNGYVFPEGNADELLQRMEALVDDETRIRMGQNSRILVEERFNWKTIGRQFLDLIEGHD